MPKKDAYYELDLHGVRPENDAVGPKLRTALSQARRRHQGLCIIHGRGEYILAAIVHQFLEGMGLEYQQGVLNPGETRVEALTLQRHG